MSIRFIKNCSLGRKGDVVQVRSFSYENGSIYYKDAAGTWHGVSVEMVEVL